MALFRTIHVCNRWGLAHIWVCPWLRDEPDRDPFDEWVIRLTGKTAMQQGQHYFVEMDRTTRFVAFNHCGGLYWHIMPAFLIKAIERPTTEDLTNYKAYDVKSHLSSFTGEI